MTINRKLLNKGGMSLINKTNRNMKLHIMITQLSDCYC